MNQCKPLQYGMFDAHALAARLHSSPYIRLLCTDAEALPRDPTALSFWVRVHSLNNVPYQPRKLETRCVLRAYLR